MNHVACLFCLGPYCQNAKPHILYTRSCYEQRQGPGSNIIMSKHLQCENYILQAGHQRFRESAMVLLLLKSVDPRHDAWHSSRQHLGLPMLRHRITRWPTRARPTRPYHGSSTHRLFLPALTVGAGSRCLRDRLRPANRPRARWPCATTCSLSPEARDPRRLPE